jgi:hypothetical protein
MVRARGSKTPEPGHGRLIQTQIPMGRCNGCPSRVRVRQSNLDNSYRSFWNAFFLDLFCRLECGEPSFKIQRGPHTLEWNGAGKVAKCILVLGPCFQQSEPQ